jgi:hypothetical protein
MLLPFCRPARGVAGQSPGARRWRRSPSTGLGQMRRRSLRQCSPAVLRRAAARPGPDGWQMGRRTVVTAADASGPDLGLRGGHGSVGGTGRGRSRWGTGDWRRGRRGRRGKREMRGLKLLSRHNLAHDGGRARFRPQTPYKFRSRGGRWRHPQIFLQVACG